MDRQKNKSQAEQSLDKLLTMEGASELIGFFETLIQVDQDLKLNNQCDEI